MTHRHNQQKDHQSKTKPTHNHKKIQDEKHTQRNIHNTYGFILFLVLPSERFCPFVLDLVRTFSLHSQGGGGA